MKDQDNEHLQDYEARANEFVALTINVCEQKLAEPKTPTPLHGEALTSAALCLSNSVKTFLAVSQISSKKE
ncbi:MAG: hypothetical protein RBR42_08505 [Desulfomicrobium sp.]|nr:hypothetical protein [Desulfomicrobium sp.]NLV96628.1 hypothetical protein [Desulfovibrionales bacterium]